MITAPGLERHRPHRHPGSLRGHEEVRKRVVVVTGIALMLGSAGSAAGQTPPAEDELQKPSTSRVESGETTTALFDYHTSKPNEVSAAQAV